MVIRTSAPAGAWELLGAANGCAVLRSSEPVVVYECGERHTVRLWRWRVLIEGPDGVVRSDRDYPSMTTMIVDLWDSILEPGPVARAMAMAAQVVPALRDIWRIVGQDRAALLA